MKKEIFIESDSTVTLKIFGKMVNKNVQKSLGIRTEINKENALEIFSAFAELQICPGNPDFVDLIQHKINSSIWKCSRATIMKLFPLWKQAPC